MITALLRKGKTMNDMIYTGMHIPTSCSMCWVRGTCEVWAMELHKQRGHGKRLDNCPLRPLVRCKDCKHFKSQTENTGVCDGGFCHAPVHVAVIDFCSYGERKDDE